MRKLVYSALALTLVSVPGFATENEWSSLDQEIANLSSSLSAQNAPGPKIGGYIRMSYRYSGDEDALFGGPPNDETESGFKLDKVRIEVSGDIGQDYAYSVSFELGSSYDTATAAGSSNILRDAYVTWKIADTVKGTMGRFKKPVLRSAMISDKNLLFTERTGLGGFFDARDVGLMFSGNFETIDWSLAVQNGIDEKVDEYNFAARISANLMGAGVGKVEGAYGAGQDTNLMVGLAWTDDQTMDDGQAIAVDAAMTSGPFSISAEAVSFDEGFSASQGGGGYQNKGGSDMHWGSSNTFVSIDPADNTSWGVTASYMFTEQYEAAVRYEMGESEDVGGVDPSVEAFSACVNRYIQGHDLKWTLGYLHTSSDDNTNEIDEWTLGLTVGI